MDIIFNNPEKKCVFVHHTLFFFFHLQLLVGVQEIHQLFCDLQDLVASQGKTVDNIERNILESEINVQKATKELGEAAHHDAQTKKINRYIAIFLILVVSVGVLTPFVSFIYKYFFDDTTDSTETTTTSTTTTSKNHVTPWNPNLVPETVTHSSN